MKAKIKKTGEIINVADYATVTLDCCNSYGNPIECSLDDIELLQESTCNINWEQRRYELIKAAMQGIIANQNKLTGGQNSYQRVAQMSINYADAVIKELKE